MYVSTNHTSIFRTFLRHAENRFSATFFLKKRFFRKNVHFSRKTDEKCRDPGKIKARQKDNQFSFFLMTVRSFYQALFFRRCVISSTSKLPAVKMSTSKLPVVKMSTLKLPTVKMSTYKFPTVKMSSFDLPTQS
jgi:hypothetical protein